MLNTREINAKWYKKEEAKRVANRIKEAAIAATFEVGQLVKDRRGNIGSVVSTTELMDGKTPVVKVDFGGVVKSFQPCFLAAI